LGGKIKTGRGGKKKGYGNGGYDQKNGHIVAAKNGRLANTTFNGDNQAKKGPGRLKRVYLPKESGKKIIKKRENPGMYSSECRDYQLKDEGTKWKRLRRKFFSYTKVGRREE